MEAIPLLGSLGLSVSTGIAIISYFLVKRDKTVDAHTKEITDLRIEESAMRARIRELERRADKHSGSPSFTNERD